MKKLYCIEIERELEDKLVKHKEFDSEPTREQILEYVEGLDIGYDDDYGRIKFYQVETN